MLIYTHTRNRGNYRRRNTKCYCSVSSPHYFIRKFQIWCYSNLLISLGKNLLSRKRHHSCLMRTGLYFSKDSTKKTLPTVRYHSQYPLLEFASLLFVPSLKELLFLQRITKLSLVNCACWTFRKYHKIEIKQEIDNTTLKFWNMWAMKNLNILRFEKMLPMNKCNPSA